MGTDLVISLPSLIPPPTTTPEIKDPCTVSEARTTWQQNWMSPELYRSFPGGTVLKNLLANAGDIEDASLIPGLGRSPGGGHGNPLQCFCLERRLAGYSPGGHKEHAWSGENDMLSLSAQRQGEASSCFLHRHLHHPTLAVISSFTTGIISHSSTTQHHHFFFKLLVIVWSQSLLFNA